ncbi:hypothetical protein M0P65_05965 [Candidatus Gracilibacteria bacterium]|jgi:hypothetical protein|nr:hypothetical protein [Candidatus Gracilibacteria bacterium]
MKIIYFLAFDESKAHAEYKDDVLLSWIIPSIRQCMFLNQSCEIHIITNIENIKSYIKSNKIFYHSFESYYSEDIGWFNKHYIHLSPNHYQFEKNAIMRLFYLRNFCIINNIDSFLHLEPDVLVYSDVIEDKKFFEPNFDMTLVHNLGCGVNFLNNSINALHEICENICNSYSIPQKEPRAFDLTFEQKNKLASISDMNFWQHYGTTHERVFKEMDQNLNGIFYQTYIHTPNNSGIYSINDWENVIDPELDVRLKKIDINDNKCFSIYKGEKVQIKYLHFHGNRKRIIKNYLLNERWRTS